MPKFIVHLYPLVRVKLNKEIEADTYEEAARKAEESINLHDYIDARPGEFTTVDIEWAEEIPYALVDVHKDSEFSKSQWVHLNPGVSFGERVFGPFVRLATWAKTLSESFGARPQVVYDAAEVLEQINEELDTQRGVPK